jgi:nucleoid-associated protein YgaU
MSIYKGSRYEYSTIDFVQTSFDGAPNAVVYYGFSSLGLISYKEHIYKEGERLDSIAYQYYKNPSFWWLIAEYNPEVLDFFTINPGKTLRIPNV